MDHRRFLRRWSHHGADVHPRAALHPQGQAEDRLTGEALALLEVSSLARGVVTADAVAKRAPVELLLCEPTTPGKYLVLFAGGVAEVDESLAAGGGGGRGGAGRP